MIEQRPRRRTKENYPESRPNTYYNYPAVKRPEWRWEVILYFFLGGLAAGSYLVATLTDLFGTIEDRPVSRAGRYLALVSIAISPLLLIADLGRRERFINMLRIFKLRSPMSVGTWGLSIFGLSVGLAGLRQAVEDGIVDNQSPIARSLAWVPLSVSGIIGSIVAFFVSGYTGVLLSFTNVPLWAKNRLLQGPLFITSALSSGLAAISLVLAIRGSLPERTDRWLDQAESAATFGEVSLMTGTLMGLGRLSRPLLSKPYGLPFWLGSIGMGMLGPIVLRRKGAQASGVVSRIYHIIASLCMLMGGLIFRWVIVEVGKESAEDPQAYFVFTRNGNERND